jgi:acylphosphatase
MPVRLSAPLGMRVPSKSRPISSPKHAHYSSEPKPISRAARIGMPAAMLSLHAARRSKRWKPPRGLPEKERVRRSRFAPRADSPRTPMTVLIARRCLVSGLVQGVFFRASTRKEAIALGLTGYASNLPDGRVEVLIVGEPNATKVLIEWLAKGPPAARVTSVDVHEVQLAELGEVPAGFATR